MSPYRNPRVLVALGGLVAGAVALVLVVNETAEGGTRTLGTLAVAVALWLGLTVVIRSARGGR